MAFPQFFVHQISILSWMDIRELQSSSASSTEDEDGEASLLLAANTSRLNCKHPQSPEDENFKDLVCWNAFFFVRPIGPDILNDIHHPLDGLRTHKNWWKNGKVWQGKGKDRKMFLKNHGHEKMFRGLIVNIQSMIMLVRLREKTYIYSWATPSSAIHHENIYIPNVISWSLSDKIEKEFACIYTQISCIYKVT